MSELEYGSLTNLMMGNSKSEDEPKVGMGATVILYTDRHACTVIKVSDSKKTFWMQRDNAKRTDNRGMSEDQDWEYTPNPKGAVYEVRKNRKGVWKTIGSKMTVRLGEREEYYDFSF